MKKLIDTICIPIVKSNWNRKGLIGLTAFYLFFLIAFAANSQDALSPNGVQPLSSPKEGDNNPGDITTLALNPIGIFEDHLDIGNPGVEGNVTYDALTKGYSFEGSGEISNSGAKTDSFHFAYQVLTGDFMIRCQVEFLDPASGDATWAKTGLMVREHLTGDSRYGFASIRAEGNDFAPQWRDLTYYGSGWSETVVGGVTGDGTQDGRIAIERLGKTYNFYYFDIATGQWKLFLSHICEITGDPVYAGVAVTSNLVGGISIATIKNIEYILYPFEIARELPVAEFVSGKTISGVKLNVKVREGKNTSAIVTETLPTGWTAANLQATNGAASFSGGKITWNLANLSGIGTLTYDLNVPAADKNLSVSFQGQAVEGSFTTAISGPTTLLRGSGLSADWKTANGLWVVMEGVLHGIALDNSSPKHAYVAKEFSTDYTVRCDVMVEKGTWINDVDTAVAGIGARCASNNRAVNLLFHQSLGTVQFLNDGVGWDEVVETMDWQDGEWYTFEISVSGSTVNGSIVKKGAAANTALVVGPWDFTGKSRGFAAVTASSLANVNVDFDNFQVMVGGKVVFSDDFTTGSAVQDWSIMD